ncbi:DUF397 domain-containing protein [Streptomyces cyaneofuscatus]|uniref:DUF397 domain-containing protein n=1 Tax=Streptomyces cyaneofuscatus TaxID=66883 RepID=UPI00365D2882
MGTGHDLTGAEWRKSSYSGPNGGDCVECTVTGGAAWQKSSYSGPTGPAITIGAPAWQAFVDGLR